MATKKTAETKAIQANKYKQKQDRHMRRERLLPAGHMPVFPFQEMGRRITARIFVQR